MDSIHPDAKFSNSRPIMIDGKRIGEIAGRTARFARFIFVVIFLQNLLDCFAVRVLYFLHQHELSLGQ